MRNATFNQFLRAKSGSIVIVFALVLLPLIFIIGAAIEYRSVSEKQAEIQNVLDAAVLDAGRASVAKDDKLSVAMAYFSSALSAEQKPVVKDPQFSFKDSGTKLHGEVTVSSPTTLLSIVGYSTLDAKLTAEGQFARATTTTTTSGGGGGGSCVPDTALCSSGGWFYDGYACRCSAHPNDMYSRGCGGGCGMIQGGGGGGTTTTSTTLTPIPIILSK